MKYENVVSGTYSGGNKRKLSVAIAMLGKKKIINLKFKFYRKSSNYIFG